MTANKGKIKYILKSIAASSLCLVLVFLVLSSTYGWFEKVDESEFGIETGSMEVKSSVYFDGLASGDPLNRPGDDGCYTVRVMQADRMQPDYIANLRVNIRFKGITSSYVRVYLVEEWYRYVGGVKYILRTTFTQYVVNDAFWLDDRKATADDPNEGYFYYNDEYAPAGADPYEINYRPTTADPYLTIPLVTGLDQGYLDTLAPLTGTYMRFKVLTQAVQANRYEEIWADLVQLPVR